MGSKMQRPELQCMDPENYRKYFQALCWSGTRKIDRPFKRKSKKDRYRRPKSINAAAVCYAPALLGNPSQFAVYATVRRSVLARWKQLHGVSDSDDSDDEVAPTWRINKITGIGLRTVFSLVSQSRAADPKFCEIALQALLDVLQGHAPEELAHESTEIVSHMHSMLVEVASGAASLEMATNLTSLGTSCLISLAVAKGEAEFILNAVTSLIMSPQALADQYVKIPINLTTLQRSVQSVILGTPSRNMWMNYGVPQQSLAMSFPVDLPAGLTVGPTELVVRALVSDGCYLYVFTSRGLLKIGSGYGSSIKQHVYLYKPDFFPSDRHGWLGFCKNKLYVRIGRKKTEVYEVDKDTLEIRNFIKLEPGSSHSVESKSAVFSDGHQLGVMTLTSNTEYLNIRFYDVEKVPDPIGGDAVTLKSRKEINVKLLRKRILALGRASYDDAPVHRDKDNDTPTAMQLDDNEDDPLMSIGGGAEFGLLATTSGKVYYTGKGASLGYKASPQCGRWTLMKETLINKNEAPNLRKYKAFQVIQVAVGHEGVHAILVLDSGAVLFTGIARRGEDGETSKHRRVPRPSRPKKMHKTDSHHVVLAACNFGSTALVTRSGILFMFGKDTQHCNNQGVVHSLRHEKVTQVALGKAHTVVLTASGQVYTFGINNKGQCGREFGYPKEKHPAPQAEEAAGNKNVVQICQGAHTWVTEYCRVCVRCRKCTGFARTCHLSHLPTRVPGERCGCGEGDSGCSICGICRQCADGFVAAARPEATDRRPVPPAADALGEEPKPPAEAEGDKDAKVEEQASGSDVERDAAMKVSSLPPARVAVPGGHKITAISCGLHHTMLLTDHGEVLTFGSNQYGQLGAGDIAPHHKLVKVKLPKAVTVAAGSNHSAVMTRDGEVYTFGNYQKGSLGRVANNESTRGIWYATPGPVPRIGPKHACRAIWLSASGDQTFMQVCQSVVKTDTLFSATIIGNSTTIIMLPNQPEHSFKCLTVNKNDSVCNTWPGAEQVDFVNTLACLDPQYDVLWCYQPQMRVMKCYNILAFDSHKLQRCCNPDLDPSENVEFCYPSVGTMRRLDDFKNLENFELISNNGGTPVESIALADMSILNQELAIPTIHGAWVTRMHIAMHLLGCLDSLIYVHDNKLNIIECKRENITSPIAPLKADWLTITRFESHGGGWGYSGHSIEAIRFMCDTDILLGGYGLFGGRGDYTAQIKLFDIGHDGGDQEGDGELIAESEEVVYECAPRDRYPVMFDSALHLIACRWYVAWASISGPSSDCGSIGQAMVINDDVGFHFKTSKKSNNGTDVNAGQIPSLLYNLTGTYHSIPARVIDIGEPIIVLSRNISRKVTVPCFKAIIRLLTWSWDSLRVGLLSTNGQVPINYQKLNRMKQQKRLVYLIRSCLRLTRSYVHEILPQKSKRRLTHEYMTYLESIGELKNLIQAIVAEETPTCSKLPRRSSKAKIRSCYVQFALEITSAILREAHETSTACFHAFFPTPTLKWDNLCSMLRNVRNGKVPVSQIRELTSTCAALCSSRSLRDVLHYVVPITQCYLDVEEKTRRPDSKAIGKVLVRSPAKSATEPRSAHSSKPPPIPPRANQKEPKPSTSSDAPAWFEVDEEPDWDILVVIPKFLDIVMNPIKQQMMTRQCGQPHDHGEIKQNEILADYCCKLIVRMVAELSYSATNVKDMESDTVKELVTPSRFMRVNTSRSWNTGNGSPDAICFTVDRPGVTIVGVGVYSGSGTYEYSLELLHDVRHSNGTDETPTSNCWVSIDVIHGTFEGADCQNDMALIKFERPISLQHELRYALRFCNHGGRTSSGDCGLPSVKGPDGTTFRFASCSLSFNGTTLARGQIPCIIYYATTARCFEQASETMDALVTALRTITLRVSSLVLERAVELFRTLRNELTAEDLRRNASVLQQSPAINILIPYILANLEGIGDSKSIINLLELIHDLLPHVTAINQLVPSPDEFTTTTTNYYTWIESEHPYRPSAISNMRVLFPPNIAWIVLEMDPRSLTAQPEDSLTIYAVAGTPKQRCHCQNDIRLADPPFRKKIVQLSSEGEFEETEDDGDNENTCMHFNCTYVSVTPKLANIASEWPQKALVIPGNEVIFALETASDYLSEYNKSQGEETRFGYRCLCSGYEDTPLTSQRQGLVALEMELVYAGGNCASKLLAPDLDVPPMVFSTLVDVQIHPITEGDDVQPDTSEALLLSRGLELSSPLTVHQVLDGQSLLRCVSTERQFLMDFIAGDESTAGGRLACWLAPTPRVDPSKSEIKRSFTPAHPAIMASLPIFVRDQYGDVVASPSLKIEVVVQKYETTTGRINRKSFIDTRIAYPTKPYQPPVKDNMLYHAISMMKAYTQFSFEELRLASGIWGESGTANRERIPPQRLRIQPHPDGSYMVNWTPKVAGVYIFRCTLDGLPIAKELSVEVTESASFGPERDMQLRHPTGPPAKMSRFEIEYSAGLRVRASPSLQAEELGRVNRGGNVAYVEEITNKDGTWVRLSGDSLRAYTDGTASVAWCLKQHRHLDKTLLVTVVPPTKEEVQSGVQEGDDGEAESVFLDGPTAPIPLPTNVFASTAGPSQGPVQIDKKALRFVPDESDTDEEQNEFSLFSFGLRPSKRNRPMIRKAVGGASTSPSGRSNGNESQPDNEQPIPVPIPEADMEEPESDIDSDTEIPIAHVRRFRQPVYHEEDVDPVPVPQYKPRYNVPTAPLRRPYCMEPEVGPIARPQDNVTRMTPLVAAARQSLARERMSSLLPPPLPARNAPAPKKHALSPAQAECLRAIFAALLWHEGVVHDAIACAAFLKFHPQLPKHGAEVVTRPVSDVTTPRNQRHSVEVTNAGNYLNIQQSTLDTLTRSGMEATTSRARKSEITDPIREEDGQIVPGTSSVAGVVNVLPPSMRALVALWDALYDSDQLSVATDKYKMRPEDAPVGTKVYTDIASYNSVGPPRVEWITYAEPTSRCELCGSNRIPPPLVAHLRTKHPGCRAPSLRGYDRAGYYKRTEPPPDPAPTDMPPSICGQLIQVKLGKQTYGQSVETSQLWYIFCERCRDRNIRSLAKSKTTPNSNAAEIPPSIDHNVMKDNAIFLLDLAPLTNAESISTAPWKEKSGRNPPTPPGSLWQPAPPFQCLAALGAAPRTSAAGDTTRYHSLGRPPPPPVAPRDDEELDGVGTAPRVHRSVSMGQAGERDLSHATFPPLKRNVEDEQQDMLAGTSLLALPSAELQRLVSGGETGNTAWTLSAFEPPVVKTESLMKSPVLSFVLTQRDLPAYRQKLDAAVRINTMRQYAFEAMNWLMRSTTQPTCVHDVMWWFCTALNKYARLVPPPDDEDEPIPNEANAGGVVPATASTSTMCPGGRSARGARAAFHSFLGSVSALAPSLAPTSASALQAVRCWALHYSKHDRNFLHRSQVFSVISKILSHSEDGIYDDGFMGAINESFQSYGHRESFLWSCADVTAWCDITVSSRQGMTGCLADGTTETFWESGDEDRNKAKWIQMAFPGGTPEDSPHIICVHVDNTRDTAHKILLVSFLYSGGSGEMYHMQDIEVDAKAATWVCYTLPTCYPGATSSTVRVRCELRGPEPSVRVRQVRLLSAPALLHRPMVPPARLLHELVENDTLRVFRLLTSQVFGKLLEWELSGEKAEGSVVVPRAAHGDSDLREHLVGILFAGNQLTCLQRQVVLHIVAAIGGETARVREDWETAFVCADGSERNCEQPMRPNVHQQDNYCFEMLSLLLALSGSHIGRAHLAQQSELLSDLLSLLHTASDRVQRQVIFLLRRMMTGIPPQKTLIVNEGHEESFSLLDHLLCYLGKAINIQVKVKGSVGPAPGSVMMGGCVAPGPQSAWFMRGMTIKKHAQLVVKLIMEMTKDQITEEWGQETRSALARYASQIALMSVADRHPARCIVLPTMWMALASLCVSEQAHIEALNAASDDGNSRDTVEPRPFCANHDDGATVAVIDCSTCGALCAECDRFLHLHRAARTHSRQICKEEESAIRIDIHEGCGRAKLFWLLLLVDRRTLKGLAEFRGLDAGPEGGSDGEGVCRFCGARGRAGVLALGNVCSDPQCQEYGASACNRLVACGHLCGGVRGERKCLPCLAGCSNDATLRQDADDMCMICFTDPLQAAPAIQLGCGHVFHLHCCKKVIASRWIGPRITFSFTQCPICKENMNHWTLSELLSPIHRLNEEVQRKALMRFQYEGIAPPAGAKAGSSSQAFDPTQYAMERYAYYVCHKCEKAYFGGLARCEAESNGSWEPSELVCGSCSDVSGAKTCPKHGGDFLEYKCRYCCSVAVFFCFGTSHFCNACHDDFQRVTNIPKSQLPQCPAGPKCEQLPGSSEECPLHVVHPPTGEEFALGCGVCRHAQGF